jgi:hypothetical protein
LGQLGTVQKVNDLFHCPSGTIPTGEPQETIESPTRYRHTEEVCFRQGEYTRMGCQHGLQEGGPGPGTTYKKISTVYLAAICHAVHLP